MFVCALMCLCVAGQEQHVSDLSTAPHVTLAARNHHRNPQLFCADLSLALLRYPSASEMTHTQTHAHTDTRTHTALTPLPPAVSCQFLLSVQHTQTRIHTSCSFSWHADERRLRLLAACHQSATHEHQSDVIALTDRALFITLTVNPAACWQRCWLKNASRNLSFPPFLWSF